MAATLGRIIGTGRCGSMVALRHSRLGGAIRCIHNSSATNKDAQNDEELHPNWSGLERRLKGRVPRQRGEGVPEGRTNLKPSEEDFWHAAGVYDDAKTSGKTTSTIAPGEAACARLSTVKVSAENLPRVIVLYKTSVAPVLQVKGFCGAQIFSDRAASTVQSLTLWESWGDLETAVGDPRYKKAMRSLESLIEAPPEVIDTEVACSILPTTGGGEPGDIA